VTGYDETFDQEITSTQKEVDSLLSRINNNPSLPYSSVQDDYAKIRTDIDAMKVRAASHVDNAETTDSVGRLEHTFAAFQAEHMAASSAAPLHPAHVQTELNTMNIEFRILMAQELAKKSGQKQGK
jgi:hypothetical protein